MKLSALVIGLALLASALPSYAGGIVMMGGGVAATGSGCTGSIGNESTADAGFFSTAANYLFLREITVTCTGTAASINARLRLHSSATNEITFVVYDSGGNRVWYGSNMYDAAIASVTGTVTDSTINYEFTPGTYRIGIMAEGTGRFYHSSTTGATSAYYSTSGFPTPPATLPAATSQTIDYEVWVTF